MNNPDSARLRCNLGMMLAEMGRFEEAEKELKEAIRREPYMGQAHYTLAVILMKRGRPDGALSHAFVATQTLPDSPQAQALFEELRRRTGR